MSTAAPYDDKLTDSIQTDAELILIKPEAEWSQWVKFMLTELESNLEPAQATKLLEEVQTLVGGRLASGSW